MVFIWTEQFSLAFFPGVSSQSAGVMASSAWPLKSVPPQESLQGMVDELRQIQMCDVHDSSFILGIPEEVSLVSRSFVYVIVWREYNVRGTVLDLYIPF